MKVILAEDVVGVGDIGQIVAVKPGYARNFLIPRGMAVEAEAAGARHRAHLMRQIEAKRRRLRGAAEELAKGLGDQTIEGQLRVGTGGKVFGAVTSRDIAEKLSVLGFSIDRRRIMLEEPIRRVGVHFVKVKLHPDVSVQLKVVVAKAAATREEEESETEQAREAIEAHVSQAAAGKEEEAENK